MFDYGISKDCFQLESVGKVSSGLGIAAIALCASVSVKSRQLSRWAWQWSSFCIQQTTTSIRSCPT